MLHGSNDRRSRTPEPAPHIERLEERIVLSDTPIIAVGLRTWVEGLGTSGQSHPFDAYVMNGVVSEENRLSFRFERSSAAGFNAPTIWRQAGLVLNDSGTFRYDSPFWREDQRERPTAEWNHVTKSNEGSQFLPQDGYSVGWWSGVNEWRHPDDIQGTPLYSERQLIVARATGGVDPTALDGHWRYTVTEYWNEQPGERRVLNGALAIDTTINRLNWSAPIGGSETRLEGIVSYGDDGSFRTGKGQRFYLSTDHQTLIFVDGVSSDGFLHIGMATRVASAPTEADVAGTCTIEGGTLTLGTDGIAIRHRHADDHVFTGRWLVIDDVVWIRVGDSTNGYWHSSVAAPGGGALMGRAQYPYDLFTLATRASVEPTRSDPVAIHAAFDADGRAIAYIDRTNAPWAALDIVEASGGPAPRGDLVAWFDHWNGLARVAGITDEGVTVYEEREGGTWTFRFLRDVTETTDTVIRSLTILDDAKSGVLLFGLTETGDLIRYTSIPPGGEWSHQNISRTLRTHGGATPAFAGNLVAAITPWFSYNIAGVDEAGDLRVMWTGPLGGAWRVSNLSGSSGARDLAGDVVVTASRELGIVYAATGLDGQQRVISWRPGDGGMWSSRVYDSGGTIAAIEDAEIGPRLGIMFIPVITEDRAYVSLLRIWARAGAPAEVTSRRITLPEPHEALRDLSHVSTLIGTDGMLNVFLQRDDGVILRMWYDVDVIRAAWGLEVLPIA